MCECLEYEDGERYQCVVCADMSRETEKKLASAIGFIEALSGESCESALESGFVCPEWLLCPPCRAAKWMRENA